MLKRAGFLGLCFAAMLSGLCAAQKAAPANVPVILLSDIHFDPFHDPGKFVKLRDASIADWAGILDAPATATQGADFDKLQTTCKARGIDTPWALLQDSLKAEHTTQPKPLFVTLSGDLMAHQFDCRYAALAGKSSAKEYSEFAAKTVGFVALELKLTFPGVPVYIALGNNDSGCKDYREDASSEFLQRSGDSVAGDLPVGSTRRDVAASFSELGDYSALLPKSMATTRLIVLQDIFASDRYTGCDGKANKTLGEQQIGWLLAQLSAARSAHEHVWVMAHIPPGIDQYSTSKQQRNVCGGQAPADFVSSDLLARTIGDFPDVITLALFGHTHMDEMRLYRTRAGVASVPGKLVPSISPVNGNNPAFTVAEVNPKTARLMDYAVMAANNQTGVDTTWSEEYRYSKTYGQKDYSVASLQAITGALAADSTGEAPMSHSYQDSFFTGDALMHGAALQMVWPAYVCSMTHASDSDYRACVCPVKKP